MSLFITGTDTGVGKTYTAARLLQLLRASGASCAGMKPICCGDRRDAEFLLAAGSAGLAPGVFPVRVVAAGGLRGRRLSFPAPAGARPLLLLDAGPADGNSD